MKSLYLNLSNGISGDMFTAAMLSCGVDSDYLHKNLSLLKKFIPFEISIKEKEICGIKTLNFKVISTKKIKHNPLSDIIKIINSTGLPKKVKTDSINIFYIIGNAESKIHNVDIDKIYFHEIGAVDSIVDIVSAALCINYFNVKNIYSTPLYFGKGYIKFSHGTLNNPAPAVLEIAKNLSFIQTEIDGELVTPTGAAIVKYFVTSFEPPPCSKLLETGYGSGTRTYSTPNYLIINLIDTIKEKKNLKFANDINTDFIYKIETNIDDCTAEIIGSICEQLFKIGAVEVYQTPVYMKKNRAGIELNILVDEKYLDSVIEFIFENTTTTGLRYSKLNKVFLTRKVERIKTRYGTVKIKKILLSKNKFKYKLEFDDCKKISETKKIPLIETYDLVGKEIKNIIKLK